ncbi:photoreceptor outer segment membrane glycoprotein 2-like [Trichoplusia ni]|uniref:Photoreceptor outer segment membrane glycoprotein 2-like n=1 Tax=Trichoplusia ni TaxID=7111 RepID=A0A7E5WHN2_TRINI|nr:photoreceptor outer segment membrane glycoprotein 2-like [Trichoplusia ni]
MTSPNHPFVVWGSCYLWLASMFAITWSLLLFICVGDMLLLTGTDIINAIVLLSGIIMLPTNVHILCNIANGRKIDHKSKVVCCPLWLCIVWIIIINCLGAGLCMHKVYSLKQTTAEKMNKTIKHYRSVPKYKHFIDNLQWSLKCCGFNSYRDWFEHDWYDKIRDYEWDPQVNKQSSKGGRRDVKTVSDSVPLSCCKSGSCISNYLLELGTHSINTKGCGKLMYRIILSSMIAHLIMFLSVVIVEALILNIITRKELQSEDKKSRSFNVRHIMSVNDHFGTSTPSIQINPDESDEFDKEIQYRHPINTSSRQVMTMEPVMIDDEDSESPKEAKKWDDD